MSSLPPGMVLLLGALLVPFLRGGALQAWLLAVPVLSIYHLMGLPPEYTVETTAFGYGLQPVRIDGLSRIFGIIFHIAALLSVIYSLHVKDRVQHAAALVYSGSAIMAVFAGDLITLFVNWELTAISSVFLIWARRTDKSYRVGMRYVTIQVLSGVLLLAGVLIRYADGGSLLFGKIGLDGSVGHWLIFLAFGIKAAFPFLHNWLQDAYPEATVTGTVWLSAFTTKLAIYSLARGFPGEEILIPIGALMAAFPIFFAVIENDLRRVLAYSLNNQLGYMVVGIGVGTTVALNGAAAHAFAHILYKGLLFMSMGAVLHRVGTVNGSDLGGLYRSMPFTTVFCIIGAAAISAFPLFSGFVSKSLILSATAHEHTTMHMVAYGVLLFASAGVFHHSGIKIPYFAFFAHDSGKTCKEAPLNMLIAMGIASALCIGLALPGVYPWLYDLLPYALDNSYHAFDPYTTEHVVTQLQLLLWSAIAFIFLQKFGLYPPELRSTVLDTDWTYRRLIPRLSVSGTWALGRMRAITEIRINQSVAQIISWTRFLMGPRGLFGSTWPTGRTALWAAIMLSVYLLLGRL